MKEVDVKIKKILSNDWDPEAAELIKSNFEFNDIEAERTEVTAMDALDLMYERRKNRDLYDVIDLDPYGTAAPFLDSALQSIENGGLLWVTFTDTAVLWSSKAHAWYWRYDSVNTHKRNWHEFALRMVLHTIASVANRYYKQIIPQLSLTADFYIRCFIKVVNKPILWHDSLVNTSHVFQWTGCQAYHLHSIGKSSIKKKKVKGMFSTN
jgi:tRNA (guanine26-N2/guanine27-N2)-dimethyltransferase